MDFLRDCYKSGRRLFAGRPDIITQGRYYFASPGTPVIQGKHCFGSTYFIRGEVDEVPIGEQIPKGYNFVNGDGPSPRPLPTKCGNPLFFTSGDTGEGVISEGPWGIISCCFRSTLQARPSRLSDLSVHDPSVQFWLAALAKASYEGDATQALALATIVLGPPQSIQFLPNRTFTPIPGFYILRYPNFSIVVVSGTTTPDQWLFQIVQLLQPPVNFGLYSTIPLWRVSAVATMTSLGILGIPDDQPILLVGHSFGGTVATQIAGQYRAAHPRREIKLVTFGMPRPGDQRLKDLVDRTDSVHLQSLADPFPALPPQSFWDAVWFGYAGLIGLEWWSEYRLGGLARQLNPDGTQEPVATTTALMTQMLALLASVIVIGPVPSFAAHTIDNYYHRLAIVPSAMTSYPVSQAQVLAIKAVYPP